MSSIRILAGALKGRSIPFNPKAFGNAEITTGKVKEALFDILGDLQGKTFADFFGGSGQIAVEALSRGAAMVLCCEADSAKFSSIAEFATSICCGDSLILLNMPVKRAFRLSAKRGFYPDFIFLDPPYDKIKGETPIYGELFGEMEKHGLAERTSIVAIQHFSGNILPETYSNFCKIKSRVYGSTALTVYGKTAEE